MTVTMTVLRCGMLMPFHLLGRYLCLRGTCCPLSILKMGAIGASKTLVIFLRDCMVSMSYKTVHLIDSF
jgi:hypothetical protein